MVTIVAMFMRLTLAAMMVAAMGCAERDLQWKPQAMDGGTVMTLSAEQVIATKCAPCHGGGTLAATVLFDTRQATQFKAEVRTFLMENDDQLKSHPYNPTGDEWSTLMTWTDG